MQVALLTDATFLLKINSHNKIALSNWVSPKRTRSYPYARVYDSLSFSGKKVTVIPIFKDEGKQGDRDFLQWDTISLMSLLGVHVIVAYYSHADKSTRYEHKVTNQQFDMNFIKSKLSSLLSYQSDALHWNMSQIDEVGVIGEKALQSYNAISVTTGVQMHSTITARKKIDILKCDKEIFMIESRKSAIAAQKREQQTDQPKENVDGSKGTITITNFLGGNYYLTSDEIEIDDDVVYLIEAKHTRNEYKLPSLGDIKDGLMKMILFANLEDVVIDGEAYSTVPVLKLTNGNNSSITSLSIENKELLSTLCEEGMENGFRIKFNNHLLL